MLREVEGTRVNRGPRNANANHLLGRKLRQLLKLVLSKIHFTRTYFYLFLINTGTISAKNLVVNKNRKISLFPGRAETG